MLVPHFNNKPPQKLSKNASYFKLLFFFLRKKVVQKEEIQYLIFFKICLL